MAKALFQRTSNAADAPSAPDAKEILASEGEWRLARARNKWQHPDECVHHPQPGTYPVVMTAETDWGGWRVPGAEYDLYPDRIEAQAKVMVNAMRMAALLEKFVSALSCKEGGTRETLSALAREGEELLSAMDIGKR